MAAQGRDANRKLQRAIRAGKARERLPALLAALGARAAACAEAEGRPFLWDGQDFEVRGCRPDLPRKALSQRMSTATWCCHACVWAGSSGLAGLHYQTRGN